MTFTVPIRPLLLSLTVLACTGVHAMDEADAMSEATLRLVAGHCAPAGLAERFVNLSQRTIRLTAVSAEAEHLEQLASQVSAWSAAQIAHLEPEDCADHLARLIALMKAREEALSRPAHYASREAGAPLRR